MPTTTGPPSRLTAKADSDLERARNAHNRVPESISKKLLVNHPRTSQTPENDLAASQRRGLSALVLHWRRFHDCPWLVRGPTKSIFLSFVVALTCYPRFWLLPRHLNHLRDLNSVLQPDHVGLAPLEAEVRANLPPNAKPPAALKLVQEVVHRHIPYAWDWDTWGVADYLPTTAETLALGREDCDGRAVVAASLLQRMGYKAWLVTDVLHMWVATESGETMSPGKGSKSLAITSTGTKSMIDWQLLRNVWRGLSYGIVVFPLSREIVILAALLSVLIHPRSSVSRRIAGGVLVSIGLALWRIVEPSRVAEETTPGVIWAAAACSVIGLLILVPQGRRPNLTACDTVR